MICKNEKEKKKLQNKTVEINGPQKKMCIKSFYLVKEVVSYKKATSIVNRKVYRHSP